MSNPYRNALVDLYAASQLYTGLNPAAADVCPAELVRRLMEAMAASAALLAQPELPELTDEVLTMTYAYAVAAAVGNRRGPYKLEDAERAACWPSRRHRRRSRPPHSLGICYNMCINR
jgi:hypothetical protein